MLYPWKRPPGPTRHALKRMSWTATFGRSACRWEGPRRGRVATGAQEKRAERPRRPPDLTQRGSTTSSASRPDNRPSPSRRTCISTEVTLVKPSSISVLVANAQRPPDAQYSVIFLAMSVLSGKPTSFQIRNSIRPRGTLTAPGTKPSSNSFSLRTSIDEPEILLVEAGLELRHLDRLDLGLGLGDQLVDRRRIARRGRRGLGRGRDRRCRLCERADGERRAGDEQGSDEQGLAMVHGSSLWVDESVLARSRRWRAHFRRRPLAAVHAVHGREQIRVPKR